MSEWLIERSDGKFYWVEADFFDVQPDGCLIFYRCYDDNPDDFGTHLIYAPGKWVGIEKTKQGDRRKELK